ncbi:hypothetical protein TanjilG_14006 [Lupinus angustifolius]|uniref:Uncharacterized protein n=1 Tax=Lupinus angustifolius TaxID=3871 RepID=A0A394DAZ3_LUPAN|nr:hypothetical protein TanjilG_14006 [Lupinus angustifolius]
MGKSKNMCKMLQEVTLKTMEGASSSKLSWMTSLTVSTELGSDVPSPSRQILGSSLVDVAHPSPMLKHLHMLVLLCASMGKYLKMDGVLSEKVQGAMLKALRDEHVA